MPRGDRTGPNGMGPMTGRAAGYCAGYETPGFANPVAGRGMGMGRGQFAGFGGGRGGRGRRNMFYATGLPGWMRFSAPAAPNAAVAMGNETQSLRGVAESLQAQLNAIKQRIADIEGGDATS
jgi:hypothetical protein